jgi:microcystin-dependent protein
MPYIGEIRMFAGSFPPSGWMFCDGTPIPISENDALFVLLGTTYGGDGQETFNLPDLRGRVPLHQGTGPGLSNRQIGESGGTESVTLTVQQIPVHTHPALGSSSIANNGNPENMVLAEASTFFPYLNANPTGAMASPITPVGGSQPHENMQQFAVINFIISLFGVFPPPN